MVVKYTGTRPSHVSISGKEIKAGDVVRGPRSLIKTLLGRDGWVSIQEDAVPAEIAKAKADNRATHEVKDDSAEP